MMIGLIPKDSLIVYSLLGVLLAIRANLIAATIAGFASAGVAMLMTSVFHSVGVSLLELNLLKPCWNLISDLPLAGWTRFNNTLVMGAMAIGLLAAFPVFRISEKWFAAHGSSSYRNLRNSKLCCLLVGPTKTDESASPEATESETLVSFRPSSNNPSSPQSPKTRQAKLMREG
jgi:uncharacterized protein (TIGR03546 family)